MLKISKSINCCNMVPKVIAGISWGSFKLWCMFCWKHTKIVEWDMYWNLNCVNFDSSVFKVAVNIFSGKKKICCLVRPCLAWIFIFSLFKVFVWYCVTPTRVIDRNRNNSPVRWWQKWYFPLYKWQESSKSCFHSTSWCIFGFLCSRFIPCVTILQITMVRKMSSNSCGKEIKMSLSEEIFWSCFGHLKLLLWGEVIEAFKKLVWQKFFFNP